MGIEIALLFGYLAMSLLCLVNNIYWRREYDRMCDEWDEICKEALDNKDKYYVETINLKYELQRLREMSSISATLYGQIKEEVERENYGTDTEDTESEG